MKRIKLKHKTEDKVKYITKPNNYPVEIDDEIRFRRWKGINDVWIVTQIMKPTTK